MEVPSFAERVPYNILQHSIIKLIKKALMQKGHKIIRVKTYRSIVK